MWALIHIEWVKTFGKIRTYLGFMAVGFFLPLVFIGIKLSGGELDAVQFRELSRLSDQFVIMGNLFNCFFVSQFMMMTFFVHIPFLIVLVGADMVAGEATAGTLRMILVRPPSRMMILTAKIIISIVYTALLIGFMALLSLGIGYLLFGSGELLIVDSGMYIIPAREALWRTLFAFFLAFLAMTVVAALSFLFSVLVENAIGPIVGAMVVVIIFLIVSQVPIGLFEAVRPYLFTTYSSVWMKMYEGVIQWPEVLRKSGYLLLYTGGFFSLAYILFQRKDILS
jgi:ABC-2 type transport system permease protein